MQDSTMDGLPDREGCCALAFKGQPSQGGTQEPRLPLFDGTAWMVYLDPRRECR